MIFRCPEFRVSGFVVSGFRLGSLLLGFLGLRVEDFWVQGFCEAFGSGAKPLLWGRRGSNSVILDHKTHKQTTNKPPNADAAQMQCTKYSTQLRLIIRDVPPTEQ